MAIVPKGEAAENNVRDISSAPGRGRPSGLGYDPATGKEHRPSGYVTEATRESTAEYDVFTLVDQKGYRPDRFYTRSLNADGHGERMQIRVPQGIDSQIYTAVATVPQYRSPHDFWRDAAIHRLEWLQKHYDTPDSLRRYIELERMQTDTETALIEVRAMKDSVVQIRTALTEHYEARDWQMLAEEIERSNEKVDWLREPYKSEADAVLEDVKHRAKEQLRALRMREK